MKEIKVIGRGGQGVVIAAEMLAYALAVEGKFVSAIPSFGIERRGTPVSASVRFDDKPIRENTLVYSPDCILIMDRKQSVLLGEDTKALKPEGILILNVAATVPEWFPENAKSVFMVDGTAIALEQIGVSVTNTTMLGSFSRATGWVGVDAIVESLKDYFDPKLLQKNVNAVRKGYEMTKIKN